MPGRLNEDMLDIPRGEIGIGGKDQGGHARHEARGSGSTAEAERVESVIPQGWVGEKMEGVDAAVRQQVRGKESKGTRITARRADQHTRDRIAVTSDAPVEARGPDHNGTRIGEITVIISIGSPGPLVPGAANHHHPTPVAPKSKCIRQTD